MFHALKTRILLYTLVSPSIHPGRVVLCHRERPGFHPTEFFQQNPGRKHEAHARSNEPVEEPNAVSTSYDDDNGKGSPRGAETELGENNDPGHSGAAGRRPAAAVCDPAVLGRGAGRGANAVVRDHPGRARSLLVPGIQGLAAPAHGGSCPRHHGVEAEHGEFRKAARRRLPDLASRAGGPPVGIELDRRALPTALTHSRSFVRSPGVTAIPPPSPRSSPTRTTASIRRPETC